VALLIIDRLGSKGLQGTNTIGYFPECEKRRKKVLLDWHQDFSGHGQKGQALDEMRVGIFLVFVLEISVAKGYSTFLGWS
jgi:hypothetical protein